MRQIGSQRREMLKGANMTLVCYPAPRTVILQDQTGKREVWYANDHHAGYTIQVGRWGYEFGHDVMD